MASYTTEWDTTPRRGKGALCDAEAKTVRAWIVDNLKVHHAKKVMAWVKSYAHEIELFFLPSYAPDHNPDEFLDGDLKQKLRQKPQAATKDDLL